MEKQIGNISPLARAYNHISAPRDDYWADVETCIKLDTERFTAEALEGLDDFSHLEVIYYFHLLDPAKIETGSRHPRNRSDWPKVGIFAQRGKRRPNQLGVSRCRLLSVSGTELRVRGLDVVNETPILDIKPYMSEFGPLGQVRQPEWSSEIMREYYAGRRE